METLFTHMFPPLASGSSPSIGKARASDVLSMQQRFALTCFSLFVPDVVKLAFGHNLFSKVSARKLGK